METSKLDDMKLYAWPFIEFREGDKQRKVAHGVHRAANLRGRFDKLDQTLDKPTLCNPSILDWGQEFKITLRFSGHIINVRVFHFQASGQRKK